MQGLRNLGMSNLSRAIEWHEPLEWKAESLTESSLQEYCSNLCNKTCLQKGRVFAQSQKSTA